MKKEIKSSFLKADKSNLYRNLLLIFLGALILRSLFFVGVIKRPELILQPDSKMYLALSDGIIRYGRFVYPNRPDDPYVERMPGYPLFISGIRFLFPGNILYVSIFQVIIGAITCVLIYILGEQIKEGCGFLSGALSVINTGLISYSIFILTDGLFVFLFSLMLIMIISFLKEPIWIKSIGLGVIGGACAFVRPIIIYFPLFISPFFIVFLTKKIKLNLVKAIAKTSVILVFFLVTICPWIIRNYIHYGRLGLQSQAGWHLLQYVIPFVWQYSKGIPFIEGMKISNRLFEKKVKEQNIDYERLNPFQKSDLKVKTAINILRKEPIIAITKAWFFGAIKNLFAPSLVDLSYLLNIERPHFFYTKGNTLIDRAWNFIKGMKGMFAWSLVGSIILLLISRFIQLFGVFMVLKRNLWQGIFFIITILYFILVSGPVGYAKYRLPFEPILIVLTAIGINGLHKKARNQEKII